MLTVSNHRRDSAGLTYVYPVISRRSGGLSVGVNLNPNNACNWRCIYCQVPGLQRGGAPDIDLPLLRRELEQVFADILHGDFYDRFQVPPDQQVIRDIAISGNGEATTASAFPDVVEIIGELSRAIDSEGRIKRVLISNGSQARRESVRKGLHRWGELGGEMWFKIDSVTEAGLRRINGVQLAPATLRANLEAAAAECPVWLQTCVFALDGAPPDETERQAYLDFLDGALHQGIVLQGVLLYGLARPSLQPEADRLSPLPLAWLENFAGEIGALGLPVKVSP